MKFDAASARLRAKGTETRFDRWLRAARQGLEGVLFVMSKEVHGHRNWSVFGMWFDFLQLCAYPLYQGKSFPWKKMTVMQGLVNVLGSLNPSVAADAVSPVFKLITVFLAAAWVAAIIAAAAYSAYAFSVGNFATVAPLKFLRATARLTTAVLFVPLASLLISVYKCRPGEKWSVTDMLCYSPEHGLLMAMVSVLLPFFWVFSLCVSAVFFDRNYRSSNIVARVHGRVGIAMISIKSLLTLVFTVAADADPWFLHIFVILVGLLWLWLWINFLPNLTQWYNRTWAAFGGVFTWAALCAALARVLNDPKSGVAGYVFLIGVPTAAYSGYALAYMRFQSFARVGTPGWPALRSAYEVELRARWLLRDILAKAQGSESSHGHHKVKARATGMTRHIAGRRGRGTSTSPGRSADPSRTMRSTAVMAGTARSMGSTMGGGTGRFGDVTMGGGGTMRSTLQQQGMAGSGRVGDGTMQRSMGRSLSPGPGRDGMDRTMGMTGTLSGNMAGTLVALDGRPGSGGGEDGDGGSEKGHDGHEGGGGKPTGAKSEAAIIAEVARLYQEAVASMPSSSVLSLLYAQFVRVFIGDRDLELSIINAGLAKDPSIDIRFLLFQSRKQLEETPAGQAPPGAPNSAEAHEGGHGGHGGHSGHGHGGHGHHHGRGHGHGHGHSGKMSLIERVQYEKLQGESVDFQMRARQSELLFWTQLRSPRPSLQRLHELAEEMSDSIAACTTAFERMLVMRPDSVEVMQAYAVFLLEVKRETLAANKYFDQADELLAKHEAAQEAARLKSEAEARVLAERQAKAAEMRAFLAKQAMAGAGGMMPGRTAIVSPLGVGGGNVLSMGGAMTVAAAASRFRHLAARRSVSHEAAANMESGGMLHNPAAGGGGGPATMKMAGADGQLIHPMGGALYAMAAASRAAAEAAAAANANALMMGGAGGGGPMLELTPMAASHGDLMSPATTLLSPTGTGTGMVTMSAAASIASPGGGGMLSPSAGGGGVSALSSPFGGAGTGSALPTPVSGQVTATHAGSAGAPGGGPVSSTENDILGGAGKRRGSVALNAYATALAKVRRASLVAATAMDMAEGKKLTEKGVAARRASIDANILWSARATDRTGKEGWGDASAQATPKTPGEGTSSGKTPREGSSKTPRDGKTPREVVDPGPRRASSQPRQQAQGGGSSSRVKGSSGADRGRAASQPPAVSRGKGGASSKSKTPVSDGDSPVSPADDRLDDDELQAVARMANVSERARAEARARQKDTAEAMAASLRMAIKAKAGVVEPSLGLLRRALTVLFAIAAVLNIVGAIVQRSLLDDFQEDMSFLAAAVERQLAAEDIVRHTHNLALMAAGALPLYGAGSGGSALLTANKTYAALTSASVRLDELHRKLYLSSGSAAASHEEKELYNKPLLRVKEYLAPTTLNPTGGYTYRTVSLSNLGVEFVSKAALVAGLPLVNITVGGVMGLDEPTLAQGGVNPNVWFILVNGPGTVRAAFNVSTLDLAERAEAHEAILRSVDYGMAVGCAVLSCVVALLVVLPIVAAVKSSTDEIFAIFLALPDSILRQMQGTCKQQISALEKLIAATNAAVQADTVLEVAMKENMEAEGSGDSDSGSDSEGEDEEGAETETEGNTETQTEDSHVHGGTTGTSKRVHSHDSDLGNVGEQVEETGDDEDNAGRFGSASSNAVHDGAGEGAALLGGAPSSRRIAPSTGLAPIAEGVALRAGGTSSSGAGAARRTSKSDMLAAQAAQQAIIMHRAASSKRMIVGGEEEGSGAGGAGGTAGKRLGRKSSSKLMPKKSLLELQSTTRNAKLIRQMSSALLPGVSRLDEPKPTMPSFTEAASSFMRSFRLPGRDSTAGSLNSGRSGSSSGRKGSRRRTSSKRRVSEPAGPRQFDSSVVMLLKLTARFVWPLLLLGAYYGGLWAYEDVTTTELAKFTHTATYFAQVHVLLVEVHQGVKWALASAPPTVTPAVAFSCNATALSESLASTDSLSATANTYQDALLFGDPSRGFTTPALAMDSSLTKIMLRDGCDGVPGMPADCSNRNGFYHGLVGDGLQPALREFMSLARYALQLRQDALTQALARAGGNVNACPTGTSLVDPPLSDLDGLANVYLRSGFTRVVDIVLNLARNKAAAFVTGHAAMAAVTVILLALLYVFWVLRSIRKMDRDIKRTRGTLLLFPTDVLAGVATFVNMAGGLGSGGAVKVMQQQGRDGGATPRTPGGSGGLGGSKRMSQTEGGKPPSTSRQGSERGSLGLGVGGGAPGQQQRNSLVSMPMGPSGRNVLVGPPGASASAGGGVGGRAVSRGRSDKPASVGSRSNLNQYRSPSLVR